MQGKEPTSRMEKFVAGLQAIINHQPGAQMLLAKDRFLVGDIKDDFLPLPMINYLKGIGWELDSARNMFAFKIVGDE